MRLITIGEIARAFGQLPSYVRDHGETFDLMVFDVLMTWEQHKKDRANGVPPNVDEATLLKILEQTKNER